MMGVRWDRMGSSTLRHALYTSRYSQVTNCDCENCDSMVHLQLNVTVVVTLTMITTVTVIVIVPSASFRSLKTAFFSLGLSHWKRF